MRQMEYGKIQLACVCVCPPARRTRTKLKTPTFLNHCRPFVRVFPGTHGVKILPHIYNVTGLNLQKKKNEKQKSNQNVASCLKVSCQHSRAAHAHINTVRLSLSLSGTLSHTQIHAKIQSMFNSNKLLVVMMMVFVGRRNRVKYVI